MLRVINTFPSYWSKTIFNISVKFNEYSRTYEIRREPGKQKREIIQESPIRISIVTEFLYPISCIVVNYQRTASSKYLVARVYI